MGGESMTSGWYYSRPGIPGEQQVGPLSWDTLYSLTQTGTLTPADLVWNPQLPQWTPAAQIQGLFPGAALPGGQTPYPAAAQPGAPWASAQPGGAYGPYPGQPPAYAAPRRRSWLTWAIPIAVLVLAGLGLGLGFGLTRGDDGNGTTVNNRTTTTRAAGTVTTTSEASTATTATATGPAGTQGNPLPVGQVAQIGNWKVKVAEATLDATQAVLEVSSLNDIPGSGSQYVLVTLEATCTGPESEDFYQGATWTFIGSEGTTFASSDALMPDDIYDAGGTSPGGTVSGNVGFIVDSDQVAGGSVMIANWLDPDEAPVYFAIE